MDWAKRAWKGEEKLWKVFWLYNVLGSIALGIIIGVVAGVIGNPLVGLIGQLLFIPYGIFLWVSQWRCAFNAGAKFWGYIVRIFVVLAAVGTIAAIASVALIGGIGASMVSGMSDAQVCMETMKDVAKKSGIKPQDYMKQHQDELNKCMNAHLPAGAHVTMEQRKPNGMFKAEQDCRKTMREFAIKNGGDPNKYIADNQAYLKQCTDYNMKKAAAPTPAVATPVATAPVAAPAAVSVPAPAAAPAPAAHP